MSIEMNTKCPFCGTVHDLASGIGEPGERRPTMPADGDLTLCISCGEWAFFSSIANGGLRMPTDTEYESLVAMRIVREARTAWVQAVAKHGKPKR